MKVLELIEAIARERCVEQSVVCEIMESILLECAFDKYGRHDNLYSKIFPDGSFEVFLQQTVSDNKKEGDFSVMSLENAKIRNVDAKIGDSMQEILPLTFGKADIEKIHFSLRKRLNEVQKQKEYEVFKDKIGQNINGYIKRVDASEAIISFPEGEGVLRKIDMLPSDVLRAGNYIKVNVKDARQSFGRQIFLSRTNEGFLRELLKQEVPEVQEGLVEIKAVSRDPGSLAKVAVCSTRSSINPVSVCIGAYGVRVQAVTKELLGEKISLIQWSNNIFEFIVNALSPAAVLKVIEIGMNKYNAVVEQDQFNKAMGRGGQNVILAKRLCNVASIRLLTKDEEAKIYQEELNKKIGELTNKLEIEEMMAHLLVSEKFDAVAKIAYALQEDIANLNGFDLELAQILQARANKYLEKESEQIKNELKNNEKNLSLFDLYAYFGNDGIKHLINNGIFQKNELAMLDAQELEDLFENSEVNIDFDLACKIITETRCVDKKVNCNVADCSQEI